MKSKTSKSSDPHRLIRNLAGKASLKGSYEYVASSILSIYWTWKI